MTELLKAEGVAKGFPGVQALRDMHLELRHGEVLALVGENGAGKSTLMKLLSGIYTPDEGQFFLNGAPYRPSGPGAALAQGVSIIHQEFNLMPHLTVAENIFIGREPKVGPLLSDRALNHRAGELLERLGVRLSPKAVVGGLTVANQQMVEIAKALSHDPQVLIMDEPTAALNDAEVAALHALIGRFTTPTTGVIYISHRMDELKAITDRITVIRDGQFIDTVETRDTTVDQVVSLMVGRALVEDARPVGVREDRPVVLSVTGLTTKGLLDQVTFDLREGEILGFAGLMGAGRTEVARAIVGADRSHGIVELRGRRIKIRNPADAARLRIGYLSEDRKHLGLLLDQDVSANIALPSLSERYSKAGWVRGAGIRATARDMIQKLRIKTPSENQVTKYLSGGNQQKVVIAKWLVKDCDILIFDEPTRGIDVGAKAEIYALLNDLAATGKSIVMISSELPEVLRMSHRVVVMTEGRVSGILSAADATQESVMRLATLRPTAVADPVAADPAVADPVVERDVPHLTSVDKE
ncbi:sugar ABC transporter ATP-binding protein [Pimelobacter simplex]|uniref:sugar ABC transporter ATP-binding protein n=1 Tax=Nocardioides simplex TaxID=2045 RepID=UPI0021501246|nr:sugar ABC transporter ATP-binding protein [Pimelobacter simplex]UUW90866.1 sugar ABC transporter ATP-binding protein [Pimelobacter simplex]UUW94695.1 sugar ABC transporter ATP-binding protein [Pimelobacter simplex]